MFLLLILIVSPVAITVAEPVHRILSELMSFISLTIISVVVSII